MNRSVYRTLGVSICLLQTLGISSSLGQESSSSMPTIFSEVLDVRVVNLEVVVTDKSGVPVRGLRPEDFILKVDGEEVPVEYFSEIRGGVAAPPSDQQKDLGIAELPAVIAGEPIETSYLVYIDEVFAISRDRNKVVRGLIEDLARLGPNDRMAIVAYNGKEIEMLSTWSQSQPELERVLKKSLERPVYGLQRVAEQRQYNFDALLRASIGIREGTLADDRFLRTNLDPNERFFLERLTGLIQSSVTAATAALRSFAMPPGRKVMLLYSGGWPFFPTTFLGPRISPIVAWTEGESGTDLFRPISDTANLLGYTVYPVDVPGFNDTLATTNDNLTRSQQPLPVEAGFNSFLREQENQYTLTWIARETGGKALINAARENALEAVVADTRSFYWLGFSPQRGWDDRRHDVQVEVRERSFKVRARNDFLDSSQQHEVAMALESTLLFGNPAGVESLVVEIGDSKRSGRKRMQVPISILIPLSEVTFLPDGGEYVAGLELRIAVRDEGGRRAEIPTVPVEVRLDAPPKPGAVGRYGTTLTLRRLEHEAVLGVFDPASGRILSASIEISP